MSQHSFFLLIWAGFACSPVTAWAQSTETASNNVIESHELEVLAEAGFAIPGSWYNTSNNQSLGSSVSGSLLGYLGRVGHWELLSSGLDFTGLPMLDPEPMLTLGLLVQRFDTL